MREVDDEADVKSQTLRNSCIKLQKEKDQANFVEINALKDCDEQVCVNECQAAISKGHSQASVDRDSDNNESKLVQETEDKNPEERKQNASFAQNTTAQVQGNENEAVNGFELGKRQRRPPMKILDADESEALQIQNSKRARTEKKGENANQSASQPPNVPTLQVQQSPGNMDRVVTNRNNLASSPSEPKQSNSQEGVGLSANDKKAIAQDPFANPFCNEIFKPIIASDKLQVLRRANECYDIFILAENLKVYNKDKRDLLLVNHDEKDDLAFLEADAANEEVDEVTDGNELKAMGNVSDEAHKSAAKPRRRKRASNLSRQPNRRTQPGSELSWIVNLAHNRKLLKEQQAKQSLRPIKRSSRKGLSSKSHSVVAPNNVSLRDQEILELEKSFVNKSTLEQDIDGHQLVKQDSNAQAEAANSQNQQSGQDEDVEMQILNGNHDVNQNGKINTTDANLQTNAQQEDDEEMKQGPADPVEPQELVEAIQNENGEETFKYSARTGIVSIDMLQYRYNMGYYHKIEVLQADLSFFIAEVIRKRCKNQLAKDYLNDVLQRGLSHLDRKKNDFISKWRNYFENKFRDNQLQPKVEGSWSKYSGAKRRYETIDDYQVVTQTNMSNLNLGRTQDQVKVDVDISNSAEYKEVLRKMTTTKKGQCGANCACQDQVYDLKLRVSQTEITPPSALIDDKQDQMRRQGSEKLNPDSLNYDSEQTCCFHNKVECGKNCGCDPKLCRNRQMTLKQQAVLGKDVEERTAWGMDSYTAFNLCALKPRDIHPMLFSEFLERRMMFAVQQQGEIGYDIRNALEFIIKSEPQWDTDFEVDEDALTLWTEKSDPIYFSYMEKELAKIILDAISQLKGQNDPHFRLHCKGLGIFCNRRDGIRKNSLLVEYFGEIYPQWLWFEKQDVLKQGQSRGQLSKDLPDFYNITYERHFDDPEGYDILTVDPILFGNFASRLSHSCNPNCETITKVKQDDKLYSIGMFSQKNIKYGEELCFNYCSFTESEEEFKSASCLCGSTICQGRFLNLAVAQKNQGLMKEYHTFIDRNLILLNAIEACGPGGEGLTSKDSERLDKFGIKSSVLSTIPEWLQKWASLICEFVEFEQEKYSETQEGKLSQEFIAIELKNLRDSKLANIAITINKVQRILYLIGTDEPPIKKVDDKMLYQCLWKNQDCLKLQLIEVLNNIEDQEEVSDCLELIETADLDEDELKGRDILPTEEEEKEIYEEKIRQVRCVLHFISQKLRGLESQRVSISALCDTLFCYAKTQTYFTPNDFQKCMGTEVHIRKCDVAGQIQEFEEDHLAIQDEGKTVYKGTKEYQAHHIWGQLVGWYKQTVDKPNSSLSADRRGSLSMPDINSFIVSKNPENNFPARNQNAKKGGSRKKGRGKQDSDEIDEDMIPMQMSSRRRSSNQTPLHSKHPSGMMSYDDNDSEGDYGAKAVKSIYPHKKFQTRDQFLENWETFYDKHFDTICRWNFKNRYKLYGSIVFDSMFRAGKDREKRLDYFREVVEELKEYSQ